MKLPDHIRTEAVAMKAAEFWRSWFVETESRVPDLNDAFIAGVEWGQHNDRAANIATIRRLTLREGAFYTARNGETVGPMARRPSELFPWRSTTGGGMTWTEDGHLHFDKRESAWDLLELAPA